MHFCADIFARHIILTCLHYFGRCVYDFCRSICEERTVATDIRVDLLESFFEVILDHLDERFKRYLAL